MKNITFCFVLFATISFAGTKLHVPRSTGKDFYIVFPKAAWGNQSVGVLINSPTVQKLVVTAPGGASGSIKITLPKYTQYYAGQFRIEGAPGFFKQEATRIQSPDPVSIHGQFGVAGISGTYTAIPVESWGTEYYAVAPPEGTNSAYWYYPTIYSVPMLTIIASQNGTNVEITPTANTSLGQSAATPFTILMNEGDVYNITTAGDPKSTTIVENQCVADLSGTHITADHPIGLLCAQSHSSWPCGFNECGDYCVEFVPPVSNWDSLYLITPSVPRLGGMTGEQLRILFAYDGTTISVDYGGSTPMTFGPYSAGSFFDYPNPIQNAIVLNASHPVLPVEFTVKPLNCQVGTSGGENWTLGMCVISGVNEWSDYVPYSSAIGSQSVANLFFRYKDAKNLKLNGKSLTQQFPTIKLLQQGFATIPISINGGSYNEMTGDSGATSGGSIFGFGTLRFTPNNGNNNEHTLDPEVIKSFTHPVGGNFQSLISHDNIPPTLIASSAQSCAHWDFTAVDDTTSPYTTGFADIWIGRNDPPDSSYNVAFNPAPAFNPGDNKISFGIDVMNALQPARAVVHLRDGAGNETDSLFEFFPTVIDVAPSVADAGVVALGAAKKLTMTLFNRGTSAVVFEQLKLKYGTHWSIVTALTFPLQLNPQDSLPLQLRYTAPTVKSFEFDPDTLLATECRAFPIGAMIGETKLPAVTTTCFDFGTAQDDTLSIGGDTVNSDKNIWVTNTGSDTSHISGLSFAGTVSPPDPAFPASDFGIVKMFRRNGAALALPDVAAPWPLAAGDTIFVQLWAHPHHTGERKAYLVFQNDAGATGKDSACLSINGISLGIIASNLDYGKHLYATTADSFFVIWNTGDNEFDIYRDGFDTGNSLDTASFVFHPYHDPVTHSYVYYDSTVNNQMFPHDLTRGIPGDTTRVPYRFIANQLGTDSISIRIINSSETQPTVELRGIVVQPRIAAVSACPPDVINIGDTLHATLRVWNSGTDSMTIESFAIEGDQAAQWNIDRVDLFHAGARSTIPSTSFSLQQSTDTGYVVMHTIATSTQLLTTTLHLIGIDGLHRHAKDSINTSFHWKIFPYDTTLNIFNTPCVVGVDERSSAMPVRPALWPMHPNPFSTLTNIGFTISSSSHVKLRITNILGETIENILDESRGAGTYVVPWNGAGMPPGIYFCELIAGGEKLVRRVVKF